MARQKIIGRKFVLYKYYDWLTPVPGYYKKAIACGVDCSLTVSSDYTEVTRAPSSVWRVGITTKKLFTVDFSGLVVFDAFGAVDIGIADIFSDLKNNAEFEFLIEANGSETSSGVQVFQGKFNILSLQVGGGTGDMVNFSVTGNGYGDLRMPSSYIL